MSPELPPVLNGFRILVTAQRRAGELGAAFERRGALVEHAPVLSMIPHVDDPELLDRTRTLVAAPPEVVVITTGVGLRGWYEAADAAGLAPDLLRVLSGARLVARGPKARGAIQTLGLTADWVAESETSAEVAEYLLEEGVRGKRIAIQHHGAGADGLDEAFLAAGALVSSLVVYRWGPPSDPAGVDTAIRQVAAGRHDAVVFTAAPGVVAFLEAAQRIGLEEEVVKAFTEGVLAAAVGSVTAAPLRAAGIDPLVPDRFRLGALVRSLTAALVDTGSARADTNAGELRVSRGAAVLDGQVLALTPSSLAVLRLLAQACGRVVSRDQILLALPGGSSDPHAVDVAVARLRDTLGDAALVHTVVRRGYRLAVKAS